VTEAHHIPLIRLFGNLIVSVQVALSDETVELLMLQVAEAIERTPVSGLILDFSGADVMDSHISRRIHDLAVMARVMGVRTVLCGLRASVVITLVSMGLSVPGVLTALNLERALELLLLPDDTGFRRRLAGDRVGTTSADDGHSDRHAPSAGDGDVGS
jgi:rsbT antagonist protein RsbS